MKRTAANYGGISSPAVKQATGRTWAQWFAVLDRAGAARLPHPEIVRRLQRTHRLADWWTQRVAVGYEQARGLRLKHRTTDGFEIRVSRTLAVPVDRAFAAWREAAQREAWLPRPRLTLRKATPHISIRFLGEDGSQLSITFWPKGPLKCQVVPHHGRLPTPESAAKMKAFWTAKLDDLVAHLEA